MKGKTAFLIPVALLVVLGIQILYLKTLPGSLVRVYYAAHAKDFNKPPTEAMTVEFQGSLFDYRIPHDIKRHAFKEIAAMLEKDNPDGLRKAILIALWVRERLHFGERDNSVPAIDSEGLLNTVAKDDLRGLCDRYSRLFAITCQSLGIPARIIELKGHVVPEAFVLERAQWVMIDPTFGYYVIRDDKPLSVVELIECYREGCALSPVVFAERRENDCFYSPASETELKEIYLNGFTVVSSQVINYRKIVASIVKHFTLLIAKVQFLEKNSIMIGSRERMIRASLVLTGILFVVAVGFIVLRRR